LLTVMLLANRLLLDNAKMAINTQSILRLSVKNCFGVFFIFLLLNLSAKTIKKND